MSLVLEIGGLFGLAAPLALWEWHTDRRARRERGNHRLRGLTPDQLGLLKDIRNPEELSRIVSILGWSTTLGSSLATVVWAESR
jgi:hypothetical protein